MLITEPNLEAPDDFYQALIDAHRDLDTAKSHELNARLAKRRFPGTDSLTSVAE